MASFRKTYRVTPDEEDGICREVDRALTSLYRAKHVERVEELIGNALDRNLLGDNILSINYGLELNVNYIIAHLDEMRRTEKKKKR